MPGSRLLLICLFVLFGRMSFAAENVLVMAYPERDKRPFIARAPNNEGIFTDVLEAAAQKLGVELKIVRLPKKRIFQHMREGKVDLYPGSLNDERGATMHWFRFGFKWHNVCILRDDVPSFSTLKDAPALRLVHEVGDSRAAYPKTYPQLQAIEAGPRIDMDDAVRLLRFGYGDLYITERETYLFYLHRQQIPSLGRLGLRYEENCLELKRDALLGFSRYSRHYAEDKRTDFKATAALTVDNQPTVMAAGSLAARLRDTLAAMQASGETERLIARRLAR